MGIDDGSSVRVSWSRAAWALACASVAGGLLAGCPGTHAPDRDAAMWLDAGPTMTFDDLDRAVHDARCEHAIRCEAGWSAASACHPAATRRYTPFALRERICTGFEINQFALRRCIEAAAAEPCHSEQWDEDLQACFDVIALPVPARSTCDRWSCGADAYCGAGPECIGGGCPWSCHPRGGDGALCARAGFARQPTIDCDEEHECVREEDVSRCRPRTHPGDACGATGCTYSQECRDGVCFGRAESIGDDCERVGCRGDLQCIRGADGAATCQIGAGVGEACSDSPLCYLSPTCVEPPPCSAGNRCVMGVCVAIAHPGDSCVSSDTCPALFHCAAGRCSADALEGEGCSPDVPCAEGVCEGGTCARLEPGAACTPTIGQYVDELGPCRVGTCRNGVCPIVVPLGSLCPTGETADTHACDQNVDCHPSTGTCDVSDAGYICY